MKFLMFFLLTFIIKCEALGNPYKILGIDKKSSIQEIKKAYKLLAKEWHPDKSNHVDAENKFIEIKSAYELLSDAERRKAYDLYGITNEDFHKHNSEYSYRYGKFKPDPFEDFFGGKDFIQQDMSFYHKISISTKYYETNVLPKSKTNPFLIIFYADWCFTCLRTIYSFNKLIDAFEDLGIIFATINAGHEQPLVRKLSISSLPSMVMVLDEHNYLYRESSFSLQKVANFIRSKMPYKLLAPVNNNSLQDFLNNCKMDNLVRALIFEPKEQPRLRYLLIAFFYRNYLKFGFVQNLKKDTKDIVEHYKVNPQIDSLLLFNENSNHPLASVSMSDITLQTLHNIIKSNQYLALPRLSSQRMLDGLCPVDFHRSKKKLCVILVTENSVNHDYARYILRRMAVESNHGERVKFAYIYEEKQKDFVHALLLDKSFEEQKDLLKVVIIWRRDSKHIKYEWIKDAKLSEASSVQEDEENYNKTKRRIDEVIQKLLKSSEILMFEAEVNDLFDEHSQNLATRVIKRIIISIDYLYDSLGKEHILPAASAIGTILFILGIGYLMSYLVRIEEANINGNKKYLSNSKLEKPSSPELKIYELRAEKYNGLVRLLLPGCRTIVLIADHQSRPKLLPSFHKAVWPYRKNKTLMFALMLPEKGLHWYTEILRMSLMNETQTLKINPRNCVGTVLALNGHRKYFCMYHAKHPECSRGNKRLLQMTKTLSYGDDIETGSFLGFEESEDSSDQNEILNSKILLEENLLDGLSNWLDRLFEGSTHRYFINYWPEFSTK